MTVVSCQLLEGDEKEIQHNSRLSFRPERLKSIKPHLLELPLCCVQEIGISRRRWSDRLSRMGPGAIDTSQSPSLTDPLRMRPLTSDAAAELSPPRRVQVPATSGEPFSPLWGFDARCRWRWRDLIDRCLLTWTRSFDKSTSPSSSSSENES